MDKDTGYGAENKAFAGAFVFRALLGKDVLDGGDAEGHIRTQAQPTPNGDSWRVGAANLQRLLFGSC